MKFTDTWLRSVQPKDKPYRVFEKGLTKGFGLQVTPKGTISFFLCYQDQKLATKYKTLGTYPVMTLAQARETAIEFRRQVEAGEVVKKEGTLQHLCDVYLEYLENNGSKVIDTIRRSLYRDVLKVLGPDRLASDITSEDVRLVMHNCIKRGSPVQSNRVRSYLHAAFNTGIKHDYDPRSMGNKLLFGLTTNPVSLVPVIREFENVGQRVLTLDELALVWNYKGKGMSDARVRGIKLMILFGGLRPSEVMQARWEEFDFEQNVWSIPPARSKNNRWHTLPLTDTILGLLKEHMGYSKAMGNVKYLFPCPTGQDKPEQYLGLNHAVKRLVAELGMNTWTPRDLRRTCKTWTGQAGLSKEIRDRLQNHALNDVSTKHYDRYLYLNEKREALLKWETFILEAIQEQPLRPC